MQFPNINAEPDFIPSGNIGATNQIKDRHGVVCHTPDPARYHDPRALAAGDNQTMSNFIRSSFSGINALVLPHSNYEGTSLGVNPLAVGGDVIVFDNFVDGAGNTQTIQRMLPINDFTPEARRYALQQARQKYPHDTNIDVVRERTSYFHATLIAMSKQDPSVIRPDLTRERNRTKESDMKYPLVVQAPQGYSQPQAATQQVPQGYAAAPHFDQPPMQPQPQPPMQSQPPTYAPYPQPAAAPRQGVPYNPYAKQAVQATIATPSPPSHEVIFWLPSGEMRAFYHEVIFKPPTPSSDGSPGYNSPGMVVLITDRRFKGSPLFTPSSSEAPIALARPGTSEVWHAFSASMTYETADGMFHCVLLVASVEPAGQVIE